MDIATGLIGLVVGFLVGLTGVGGAALLTPVLIWIGISPAVAVGTDLFYNSITKFFGGIQHWRQQTVHWRIVAFLAAGSIPGAVVAVGLLHLFEQFFDNQEHLIRSALGVMLVVVSLSILLRLFVQRKDAEQKENKWHAKSLKEKGLLTAAIGFVLGFVVGLTSVGSGSLFAIALIYLFRMKSSEVVGTDIVHAFFLVLVAGALHAGMGNVDYGLAINLLIGSIPGVLAGSALSAKVPAKPLKGVIATLILLSGIKLI